MRIEPDLWADPGTGRPSPAAARAKQGLIALLVCMLAVLSVVTGLLWIQLTGATGRPAGWPSVSTEQRTSRLQPVVAPPPGAGGFGWETLLSDGEPLRWDPCQPIHYVINPVGQIPGGTERIQAAVAQVSALSGLVFVFDGFTEEAVSAKREGVLGRYGDRWAPVLFSWATPAEVPRLAGTVTGLGGSAGAGLAEDAQSYITGAVIFDGPQLTAALSDSEQRTQVQGVIRHEIGHLLGLAHVDDPAQLMYRESLPSIVDFAEGDLRGLALAGAGACDPTT